MSRLQDGKWLYTWDANNRLVAVETREVAYNAGAPRQKLEFAYDSQGRRVSKKVYDWDATSNSYLLTSSFLYLYDGWNLIAELKYFHSSLFTILTLRVLIFLALFKTPVGSAVYLP